MESWCGNHRQRSGNLPNAMVMSLEKDLSLTGLMQLLAEYIARKA